MTNPQTTQAAAPTAPFHFCLNHRDVRWDCDGEFCCEDNAAGQLCDFCQEMAHPMSSAAEDRIALGL
jgi:hypothetical protein